MGALAERRRQDIEKLRALAARSAGRVSAPTARGRPPSEIEVSLRYRTAPSADYPRRTLDEVRLHLQLSARYPFVEPVATLLPVPFHPNVYVSGRVCLGSKWLATEGLDLLVRRIARIVTFAPDVLNLGSPANREAARWYGAALSRSPGSFPTDRVELGEAPPARRITWSEAAEPAPGPATRVIPCQVCGVGLRVPAGPAVRARCPRCGTERWVSP